MHLRVDTKWIPAILRYAEEFVDILCPSKRVQSSYTEEQIVDLMESVFDSFESNLPGGDDEEVVLSKARSLLMKAMHVITMSERVPR